MRIGIFITEEELLRVLRKNKDEFIDYLRSDKDGYVLPSFVEASEVAINAFIISAVHDIFKKKGD